MEQPLYYWDPVIGPSGMAFYTGNLFPAWKGSLFIGGHATNDLVRLTLDGEKVVGEERLLTDLRRRAIRDVRQGPDGALYLLTDSAQRPAAEAGAEGHEHAAAVGDRGKVCCDAAVEDGIAIAIVLPSA